MANNYQSNINTKLLKSFAKEFESSQVLGKTVSKQLVNDFDASTGRDYGSVAMKRPPQYVPQRTSDGDLTSSSANPVKVGRVQAEVSDYITVFVENTQVEEALEADQLDELLKPIAMDMTTTLESELANYMAKNAALQTGDPDNAIAKWSDVAEAGALLKEIGAPSGMSYGVINNFTETALSDLQTQLGVNNEVGDAWSSAMIKRNFAGLDVLTTNNLPLFTAGNTTTGLTVGATPSATYASYKDTYRMTITLAGATPTIGTLNAGTVLQFEGSNLINMRNRKTLDKNGSPVKFTATVLEDATADGSGNIIVNVSGAAIFETLLDGAFNTVDQAITSGDSVTVLNSTAGGTYRPELAYCRDFVGMGSVILPKLHALDSNVMNFNGNSIRVHRFSDGVGNKNRYRFDLLPTFATFNPAWGVKMGGNP